MQQKRLPGICLLLFSFFIVYQSCTKIDARHAGVEDPVEKFFTVPAGTEPQVKRVIENLREQNKLTGFINELAAKEGYAVWDKAMVTTTAKPELNTRNAISGVSDTIIYIPLVLENGKHVNSFIYAKLNGSVHLRLYRGREYSSQGYDSSRKDNAEKLTLQLMMLDKQVFGYKKFMINDCRLFKDKATDTTLQQNKHRQLTLSLNNPGANWHWEQGEVTTCTFTWEYIDDPVHSGIYISQGWFRIVRARWSGSLWMTAGMATMALHQPPVQARAQAAQVVQALRPHTREIINASSWREGRFRQIAGMVQECHI